MASDFKKHLAWVAILPWLVVNVALFADQGSRRIEKDRQVSQVPTVAQKRALAWGPEFEQVLVPFEAALNETAKMDVRRVLLVAPPPRNVFESLAWHMLFPAAVEIVPSRTSTSSPPTQAIEHHADAVIYAESPVRWRAIDVRSASDGTRR
jgi:hypothetical protein